MFRAAGWWGPSNFLGSHAGEIEPLLRAMCMPRITETDKHISEAVAAVHNVDCIIFESEASGVHLAC